MGINISVVLSILGRVTPLCCVLWAAAFTSANAAVEQRLKSFGFLNEAAAQPSAPLLLGADGCFYGTTSLSVLGYGGIYAGTVFKLSADGASYTVLRNFSTESWPGPLVQGRDGNLYGVTAGGGDYGNGSVFKLGTNGTGYATLHSFCGTNGDGFWPSSGVLQGLDGSLYGTTPYGGSAGSGTVFKLNTDGTGYAVIHNFSGTNNDGGFPVDVLQTRAGVLCGTTGYGGTNGGGTLFKMNTDGSGYALLHDFSVGDGSWVGPSRLVQGCDRALYGTTAYGGSNKTGMIFKMNADGTAYSDLYDFSKAGTEGSNPSPVAGLLQGTDGALYGTATYGGTDAAGTVFKVNTDGAGFAVLHDFTWGTDGWWPFVGLVQKGDGALYGTTSGWNDGLHGYEGPGSIFSLNPDGTSYVVLRRFSATAGDAANPNSSLALGRDGAWYGTTEAGAVGSDFGAMFKVNGDGSGYALLHYFTVTNGDGLGPQGLVLGGDGAMYGTTYRGGSNYVGTVFRITSEGTDYSILHSFGLTNGDGFTPGGLVAGSAGDLFGTAAFGGSNGAGAVFRLNIDGSGYALLHEFCTNGADGQIPVAVVLGDDGALYGTTSEGGNSGNGTIFKLGTNGTGYATLHSFIATNGDGYWPAGPLVQRLDALYGTTFAGGRARYGTLFKLNTDGTGYRVLHNFDPKTGDGYGSANSLLQGDDGALYGTTYYGGSGRNGTVFRINIDGSWYAVLYNFGAADGDGINPAGLAQAPDGTFYGATLNGGDFGLGTIFRFISPPILKPITLAAGTANISWWAMPGWTYQLQFKAGSEPAWINLGRPLTAAGNTLTASDAITSAQRFYRAVLLPSGAR